MRFKNTLYAAHMSHTTDIFAHTPNDIQYMYDIWLSLDVIGR